MREARKRPTVHEETGLARSVDWQNPRVVQILDAASRCFAKSGFYGTTIQDIADEAGLTKSMVHYYFESKQALIQELQAFAYERHFRRVEQRLAEAGPGIQGRAQEALYELFEIIRDKPFLRLQQEIYAEAGRDPTLQKRQATLQKKSRELIDAGIKSAIGEQNLGVPLEVLSVLLASVIQGLRVIDSVEGEAAPTKEAYDLFVAVMLMALDTVAKNKTE